MKSKLPNKCELCAQANKTAFADLSDEERQEVDKARLCIQFKKGQDIMHEGMRPNGMYCIHKGKVKLYRMGSEGKEQILRFAKDGDLVGYRSLLSDELLSASVGALEDTQACFIPKATVINLVTRNSKFSLNLMKLSCHELGQAGKIITNLAQKSVRERLAEVLLLIEQTFGTDEAGFIDVKLTREEIANMVGTATESVIRMLADFKGEGMLKLEGRKIMLVDKPLLTRVGNVYD